MSDLQFIVAGALAGAAFVEFFVRLGTLHRLSTLAAVTRRATSVITSHRISDHWKEIVVPWYAKKIFQTVVIATFQLMFAVAVYTAVIVVFLAWWMDVEIGVAMFLGSMLNIGAVAGGVLYALVRQRIAR